MAAHWPEQVLLPDVSFLKIYRVMPLSSARYWPTEEPLLIDSVMAEGAVPIAEGVPVVAEVAAGVAAEVPVAAIVAADVAAVVPVGAMVAAEVAAVVPVAAEVAAVVAAVVAVAADVAAVVAAVVAATVGVAPVLGTELVAVAELDEGADEQAASSSMPIVNNPARRKARWRL